jgi:predicted XRE-type DNA-binding protein
MKYKNAFTALGLDADTATIDTLRTDIALALREFIERSGLGQVKVGQLLNLKQSVVSHIVRGEIEHLSVERLIRAMVKAKLPGFAEWGESAEEARAGSGYRPAVAQTPVISTPAFVVPGTPWQDANAENIGQQSAIISARSTIPSVPAPVDNG